MDLENLAAKDLLRVLILLPESPLTFKFLKVERRPIMAV
jgi:hypothetical protein